MSFSRGDRTRRGRSAASWCCAAAPPASRSSPAACSSSPPPTPPAAGRWSAPPGRTLRGGALDVLIGGLGIGDALDEALACERVASRHRGRARAGGRALVPRARGRGGAARRGRGARRPRAHRHRRRGRPSGAGAEAAGTSSRSTPTTAPSGWCAARTPGCTRRPACAGCAPRCGPGGVAVFWSPERYPPSRATSGTSSTRWSRWRPST